MKRLPDVLAARHGPATLPSRPQGSAAVTMMLVLLGLVVVLGLVEIGYLYWSKRDVQKTADLAALAGAQRLELCTTDYKDNLAARRNATTDNSFQGQLAISCGYWGSELPSGARFTSVNSGRPLNAVQVTASRDSLPFFGQIGDMPRISATAVARRTAPQAAFSVGSRLLNINNNAPLQGLLRLVGIDLNQTQVASYQGLAQVKITPRGLLDALGIPVATDISVGELNNLLAAKQVSVARLLDIMADLGARQEVAGLRLGVLQNELARVGLDKVLVQLGSTATSSGLFAQIAGGSEAAAGALDVDLNALEVLGTGISIANASHAVAIPRLDLLGLLKAKASIVEPASLGIGPVGTTAYNSQVRVFLDIDTNNLNVLGLQLGSLLDSLGTRIRLPTYIDVIDGYGTLTAINCSAQPATATVSVDSSIANVCIGKASTAWDSTAELCSTGLQEEQLITLFNNNVLTQKIPLRGLSTRDTLTLSAGQVGTVKPNEAALGTLVSNLTNALFNVLQSLFKPAGSNNDVARNLAIQYLDATKVNGIYDPAKVVDALRAGYKDPHRNIDLPPLGSWTTKIPVCEGNILICIPQNKDGDVWQGFLNETTLSKPNLLGGLFDILGITSCSGIVKGLAFNECVRNSLTKYLQTKQDGFSGNTGYDPTTATGTCSSVLCILLKPVVDGVLQPVLDGIGKLLSVTLSEVLGLQLGRTDVHMQSIQCGRSQLVE